MVSSAWQGGRRRLLLAVGNLRAATLERAANAVQAAAASVYEVCQTKGKLICCLRIEEWHALCGGVGEFFLRDGPRRAAVSTGRGRDCAVTPPTRAPCRKCIPCSSAPIMGGDCDQQPASASFLLLPDLRVRGTGTFGIRLGLLWHLPCCHARAMRQPSRPTH